MLRKVIVLGFLANLTFGLDFQQHNTQFSDPDLLSQNDLDFNFVEYSDVGSDLPSNDVNDYYSEKETSEGIKESPKTIFGTRRTDAFNPETMFQDSENDGECMNFPNQTMIRPHFFSCNSPVRPPILVVHDSAVANSTGDYKFPLDFTQTVRFFFDVTSFATRRYDNIRAEVYLYRRKMGWLGCGWLFLPTFGIIDNYDVCEDNLSCPIYPGRQVIEVSINPKVAFSGIFKMIHNKKYPYQLIIRLVDNRSMTEELMCVLNPRKFVYTDDEEAVQVVSPVTVHSVPVENKAQSSFQQEPTFETISEDDAAVEFPIESYQEQQRQQQERLVTIAPLTPMPPVQRPKLKQVRLPKAHPSAYQQIETTTIPPELVTAKRDSQNRPLVLSPEHCSQIKYYADQYGVTDPLEWVHNNCNFAKMYLPTATCEEIDILVGSCNRKVNNK